MVSEVIEKSPFAITPLSADAPSRENSSEYPHNSYISRNHSPWRTFSSPTVYGSILVRLHVILASGSETKTRNLS